MNIDGYSGVYLCTKCGRHFGQIGRLKRHQKSNNECTKFPKEKFPGGFFKRKLTVFEKLDTLPIGGITHTSFVLILRLCMKKLTNSI